MECKECGYAMSDFDIECPRCLRLLNDSPPKPAQSSGVVAAGPDLHVVSRPVLPQTHISDDSGKLGELGILSIAVRWLVVGILKLAAMAAGIVVVTVLEFVVGFFIIVVIISVAKWLFDLILHP